MGDGWETADNNMKSAQSGEKAAKEELVEAKAKNQELSLQSDKLSKDLESAKTDLSEKVKVAEGERSLLNAAAGEIAASLETYRRKKLT